MHDSNLAAESRFYEVYIQPLLKNPQKKPRNIRYFFYQGWLGWRHSVKKGDLARTKFIEGLCEQLYNGYETEFLRVAASLIDNANDTGLRSDQAEESLYEALKNSEIEPILSAQLNLYKTLFESDFRLYGTIPYFYLCKKYGKPHQVSDAEKFVEVSAGEKFHTIRDVKISLPQGQFSDLVSGFDNHIRNAGAGHDRWELTDKDTMILKVVDAKSGKEKKRFEFSQREFRDILERCRVNLWILRNGFTIFLENNPEVEEKIASKHTYKTREIKDAVNSYTTNRSFEIKEFKIDDRRTHLELSIKYTPPIIGRGEQLFFGTAEAYDIVHQEIPVRYEYQMLDIIKYCLLHLDKSNPPKATVHMYGEKDEDLGVINYESAELKKLLNEEGEIKIPIPSEGKVPEVECKIDIPIRVPYGQGSLFEKLLEERRKRQDKK